MSKIAIVEDDRALREELSHILHLNDFQVSCTEHFGDADTVAREVLSSSPDCIVLDLKLPGVSGLDICRSIRGMSDTPLIILTSSDSEFDELMGMNLGADDYVTKPYNPAILIARIRSVIRRGKPSEDDLLVRHKGVVLDVARGEVSADGKKAVLTRNELTILTLLMRNHDTIISRQELMAEIWNSDEFIDDNTLTVNINRLRKSLSSIGIDDYLATRRGQGYMV